MILVTNWASYQSYKDRKPPWIRLHKSLLDNYDFHKMSANARALLPMLWLLASEDKDPVSGSIRYGYDEIAFRLRLPIKDIRAGVDELSRPNDEGEAFIQLNHSCNETVTEPLRNRTQTVTSETETETETEKRQRRVDSRFAPPSLEELSEYCKSRNNLVDPIKFHSHYTANGWRVGKNAMKDWKAAVVTWERRN